MEMLDEDTQHAIDPVEVRRMSLEEFTDHEILEEYRLRKTRERREKCHKAVTELSEMIDDVTHTTVDVRYHKYSDDPTTDMIIFYIRHREDDQL